MPPRAALREIYDGSWTRHVGTDGGKKLHWDGKVAVVASVTPTIDRHHAVTSTMGERFIYFRLPAIEGDEQSRRALSHVGKEDRMRKDLSAAVKELFDHIDTPLRLPDVQLEEENLLIGLSTLAVRLRSAVERDGHSRDIELIPEPESPARLTIALRRIVTGMLLVGVEHDEAWRVVCAVAMDSAPKLRRRVFEILATDPTEHETPGLATKLGYPTSTTRRALEDLNAHGLVKRVSVGAGKADTWRIEEQWEMQYAEILGAFPKCQ